jgi:ribonuclease PH
MMPYDAIRVAYESNLEISMYVRNTRERKREREEEKEKEIQIFLFSALYIYYDIT